MRITPSMMSKVFVTNLQRQAEAMLKRQEQIATQKRINRPSDDPAGMGRVLNGRSRLAAIDQYEANIKQGKTRLEFSEETLKVVGELVRQARRMAEQNYAEGVTAEERTLAASDIKEIYDQVMQLANTKFGERYMFAGHQTDAPAFTRDDDFNATYHGDDGSFRIPVADGVEVSVDADGRNYFYDEADGGVNIFDELRDLIDGLENSNLQLGSAQIRATIDPLGGGERQIMDKRTELGPKLYRLQATEEHWQNLKPAVQAAIGRDEDVDVTEAIIELKNLETAYQATMATAARILQSGLADFLK